MEERKRIQKHFTKPSMTRQAHKNECDVNLIMQRFKKVCGDDYLNRYQSYLNGEFGDFSEVADYRTALDQVKRADEVFMALPSKVRGQFDNDAASFLDFVQNPANADELIAMGLATKPKIEQPEISG